MDTSRIRTHLLRGGVSLAALAAAWGMPTAVQAQTCRTAVDIDGVAAGTDVTCPFSDVLTFPGGVSQGPGGVPNGSQLLGVLDGTSPTHQQWTFQDSAGNIQFIFLSGDYNLRNGVGGTTVLEGAALRNLSGAGLCGVGGQLCPPGGVPTAVKSNVTGGSGGGAGGTFLGQPILDPFVGNGGFQQASADASGQAICDAMPAGASCGGSIHFGPVFDASGTPRTGEVGPNGDITIYGQGFGDYLLDVEALPDDVAEDYRSCGESGASGCAVVFDNDGTPFVYGPSFADETFPRVPVAPLVIVTDGQGNTAADFDYTWNVVGAPEGAAYDFAAALRQHAVNSEVLRNANNNSASPGLGAQGTFSTPGLADGSFLYTSFIAGTGSFVVSFPLTTGEAASYLCDQGGCGSATAIEVAPFDSEADQPPPVPEKLKFSLAVADGYEVVSPVRLSMLPLLEIGKQTTIGMGPITGGFPRGDGTREPFKLQRWHSFIVLSADSPAPGPSNPAIPPRDWDKERKPGNVVYSRDGTRIGVIVDNDGTIVIDDDQRARNASGVPYQYFNP